MKIGFSVAGLLGVIVGAPIAHAADGLGIEPLSCGAGTSYGIACAIGSVGGLQFRDWDPRVDGIQRGVYAGSGSQTISPGDSQTTIDAKVAALTAGNHLILANGTYTNLTLTVNKTATFAAPITIRPLSPGGVNLRGTTKIRLYGAHVIVADLKIEDGSYPSSTTVLAVGDSGAPCNSCIATNLRMANLNGSTPAVRTYYVNVRGRDVTVAYSTFDAQSSGGHYISDSFPTEGGLPARLHVFRNRFYHRTWSSDENGYELLQLGESGVQAQSMFGRMEENLIEGSSVPNADTELVTVKSSDWIIRNNTIRNSVGDLCLRSTNRVLVEGNFFLGGSAVTPSATALRVHGAGHWIVGNYFYKNANPEPTGYFPADNASAYYYSLAIPAGQVDDVTDGEASVPVAKNIVVANNTFAYGVYNIHLGSFYSGYPKLPSSVVLVNNLARTDKSKPLVVLPNSAQTTYVTGNPIENNLLSASTIGLAGFVDPDLNWSSGLAWAHDGYVYRATEASSSVDAAEPLSAFPVVPSGVSFDVGAFQLESPFRRPLAYSDVGYRAPTNHVNLLTETEAVDGAAWLKNRLRSFVAGGSVVDSTATVAPDGTHTAELMREDDTTGTHSFEQRYAGDPTQTYTFSTYLKSGGAPAAMLYLENPQAAGNGVALRVDLTSGNVSSAYASGDGALVAGRAQPLGNGWYRLSLTGRASSVAGSQLRAIVYLLPSAAGNSVYTGNNAAGVYAWGAQLEKDVVATVLASN